MPINLIFVTLAGLALLSACGSSPKFDKSDAAKSAQMNAISVDTPQGAGSQVNASIFVGPDQVPPSAKRPPKPST